MRTYAYLGRDRVEAGVTGAHIRSREDLRRFIDTTEHEAHGMIATFVVLHDGLHLAPRRSEHVRCAGGGEVLSAGEMTFEGDALVEVTNLSTGYCPDPESWAAVASALDLAGIEHPGSFTHAFVFRICSACGQRNLIKDDVYECAVCNAELRRM
jgi:hypothetical protein